MPVTTGLSGNDIFCLAQKGYTPGNIVVGNSVYSLGLLKSISSGLSAMFGGEVEQVTKLIEDGRETSYKRMFQEAVALKPRGITGVKSELILHAGNIEFLSIGSAVHSDMANDGTHFSTSANAQELYAQLDAGYKPISFAFGNVAYSIGVGGGLMGGIKSLARGEIKEYSSMFNRTRHLALERIVQHAKDRNANAVLGIETTILPFAGVCEMLMVGTASFNPQITKAFPGQIVTSDMTNIEMWNMAAMGYAPLQLVLGTSVYSLGLIGGITSAFKSFVRGEINELTQLIYDARENALAIVNDQAKEIGADDVVGVKTYVYQLGSGLIEFLAIGTAVKKMPDLKNESSQLPPQAFVADKETFYNGTQFDLQTSVNQGAKPRNQNTVLVKFILNLIGIVVVLLVFFLTSKH